MSVNTLAPAPDHEPAKDRTGLVTESQLESLGKLAQRLWSAAQPLEGVNVENFDRGGVFVRFEDQNAHYMWLGEDGAEVDLFIEPAEDDPTDFSVAIDTVRPTGRKEGDGAYAYERRFFPLKYGEHATATVETGDFAEDNNFFHGQGDLKETSNGEMTAAEYEQLDRALNELLGPDVQLSPESRASL